jgi:regulatory protein
VSEDRLSDPIEARKKAMDYLARREHGRSELFNKLTRFGFEADVADDAVAQLVEDGIRSLAHQPG